MIIEISHYSFDFFKLFIFISLIILFAGFYYHACKKNHIPAYKVGGIFFLAVILFLLGAKSFTFSYQDWKDLFTKGIIPKTDNLTVLGALLGGPLGIILGKKIFRVNTPLIDFFSITILLSLSIQRIGCVFSGCCHGLPTGSDFGVSYGCFTSAHMNSFKRHWVHALDEPTSALHPTPIYLLLASAIGVLVLLWLKKQLSVNGNKFLAALALYLIGRFAVEFFRDPLTNGALGANVLGLKLVQWVTLGVAILFSIIIAFRQKKHKIPGNEPIREIPENLKRDTIVFLSLMLIALVLFGWYNPLEKSITLFFGGIYFLFFGVHFLQQQFHQRRWYLSAIAASLMFLVIMPLSAQMVLNNSGDERKVYNEINVGYVSNNYEHRHQRSVFYPAVKYQNTSGCGSGDSIPEHYVDGQIFAHEVKLAGIMYRRIWNLGNYKRFTAQGAFSFGKDSDNDPKHADNGSGQSNIYNFLGGVGFDSEYVGFEFNLHLGTFRPFDIYDGHTPKSMTGGSLEFRTVPSGLLRIGTNRVAYFYMEAGAPTLGINLQSYPFMFGIGTGLGRDNTNYLRFSLGFNQSENLSPIWSAAFMAGVSGKFMITKHASVEGEFGYGRNSYFQVGSSFYFGHKDIKEGAFVSKPKNGNYYIEN